MHRCFQIVKEQAFKRTDLRDRGPIRASWGHIEWVLTHVQPLFLRADFMKIRLRFTEHFHNSFHQNRLHFMPIWQVGLLL
jgi:hypothetical protein